MAPGPGPFAVFAPTNAAFAALPPGVLANLLLPGNKAQLVDILTYHVVPGTPRFHQNMQPDMLTTVEGGIITVSWQKCGGGNRHYCFFLTYGTKKVKTRLPGGESHVTSTPATNGAVYAITNVLIPPAPNNKTIVDLAVATPDLSTLVVALKAGGLVDTLNGPGPFTVFAPTNEAFAALPPGTLATLLLPQNKAQLVDILTYHVVAGKYNAKDLHNGEMLTTVEGKNVTVTLFPGRSVEINKAIVIKADVDAVNGVVHIINGVLLPPAATPIRRLH